MGAISAERSNSITPFIHRVVWQECSYTIRAQVSERVDQAALAVFFDDFFQGEMKANGVAEKEAALKQLQGRVSRLFFTKKNYCYEVRQGPKTLYTTSQNLYVERLFGILEGSDGASACLEASSALPIAPPPSPAVSADPPSSSGADEPKEEPVFVASRGLPAVESRIVLGAARHFPVSEAENSDAYAERVIELLERLRASASGSSSSAAAAAAAVAEVSVTEVGQMQQVLVGLLRGHELHTIEPERLRPDMVTAIFSPDVLQRMMDYVLSFTVEEPYRMPLEAVAKWEVFAGERGATISSEKTARLNGRRSDWFDSMRDGYVYNWPRYRAIQVAAKYYKKPEKKPAPPPKKTEKYYDSQGRLAVPPRNFRSTK
jgi:hypothetical protein